jgi:methionine synthase II (cobalamin-independent)
MSRQAKNEFYKDEEERVMDYAVAVNAELRDLKAAGADVIQLDEPWLQARTEEARRLALPAIDRALDGIPGPSALHLCFGYAKSPATSRMFTRFCRRSRARRSIRSRSKPPSPISTSRPSTVWETRP